MKKNQIPGQIILAAEEIPKQWYNIKADMPNRPPAAISPRTHQPVTADELNAIFPMGVIEQEVTTERYIDIPAEVMEKYRLFRSTPLHRAYELEKALGTPARIYYKYEGTNPSGSHKLNSAVAQAYYNKTAGMKRIVTETGAGQWGTALAMATKMFEMDCTVYMVKVSYQQKPYRRSIMQLYGAEVIASPSNLTEIGRQILSKTPDTNGSLGDAIAEAVEIAATNKDANYALGSVLDHVILHQTIIGQEAKKQMELVDEYPDIIIGCNGGGSNFSGLAFPFLKDKFDGKADAKFIAVEAAACPKLTKGVYTYDYGDSVGMAPIAKMYSLGHSFRPSGIHAGGLRYHGDSPLLSQVYHDGFITAEAVNQTEVFESALLFAQKELIVPAPESAHAICQAVKEAEKCKESGEEKVILFNLSGHGYFDMTAYDMYLQGHIVDDIPGLDGEILRAQDEIKDIGV
ncbi:MAG: TrpB-like pyridoxal phosphate-dependent enzyme [Oscillospiraceae bacterium]|nr:TrpB-like pyridoxal phosphate-dependent enzyme [Oscillospiraceae bacterium]